MKTDNEEVFVKLYNADEIDEDMLCQCEKVAYENHIDNGGTLKRSNIVGDINTEYIVCASDEKGNVLGFAAIREDYCGLNDLYIRQIAVSTKKSRQGIGTKIMECLIDSAKNKFDFISADINKANKVSCNFFVKNLKFKEIPAALMYSKRYVFDLRKMDQSENVKQQNKR